MRCMLQDFVDAASGQVVPPGLSPVIKVPVVCGRISRLWIR